MKQQLLKRKRSAETQLETECAKRRKLESEVRRLEKTAKKQSRTIALLKSGHSEHLQSHGVSVPGNMQQHNRRRTIATEIQSALSFCEEKGFKPHFVELENIDTQKSDILDVSSATCTYSDKENVSPATATTESALFLKDKYCVSNQAYHELSVASNLPSSNKVKKLAKELNSKFEIKKAPNGVVGVQQSLRSRLIFHVSKLARP